MACLNTSVLLACCLCLLDGALTESGDCSDVWNVRYSSAHYTTESRRGLVHVSLLIVGHDIHTLSVSVIFVINSFLFGI